MADDGLRFEAWTWPLVGTLTKKFDFTKWIDSYTINDRFNDLCDGTITLSDDFPKKDQIFFIDETNHALDVGSMVRVLRGTTPIAHYLVTRSEDAWADGEPTHKLTLEGLEWILDRTTVPHYDYPADPTKEPDWIYGADTLLANAFLEDSPQSLELQHFYHTQGAGTYTITYSGQTTSALAFNASWFDVHQALEALSNIQDVVVTGDGTAESPFEIEFLDPSGNLALLTSTATGQNVYSLTEGGIQDPAGWTKSFHPQTGEQHGQYFNFDVSSTQNHTPAGTYSLRVVADVNTYPTDYPGVQQIQNVTGGRTYRAEMWVYPTTTMDFRLIVRTMDETAIDGAIVEATLTANSWQKLTIPPFEVPQHISQVIVRLGLLETGGGTFFVDDGVFAPGFPAAALGFIMNDLRTAMIAQGTLGWITPTWTTTVDTDGNAWDQDLKWLVNHDQTLLQLFEYMRQWNYEWRIRWDVADNRFEWDMWNPLGGGQTRANIAITGKSGVTQGNPIVKRPPGATYVRVEGELGRWGENASTTLDDVWGRLEKAVNDRQGVDSLQLDTFATRLVVREGTDTAGRAVTVEDPSILPWQAYEPGDTVTLNLAPKDTKQALRVVALVASMSPGQATPRYDVHFVAPVLSNDAAMAQGLRTLWRKFNAFRPNTPAAKLEPPPIAGKGGMATVLIAASNATDYSKTKADFVCTGTNDDVVIQRVITELLAVWGGTVWLSEGRFFCSAPLSVWAGVNLRGLHQNQTQLRFLAAVTGATTDALNIQSTALSDMTVEAFGDIRHIIDSVHDDTEIENVNVRLDSGGSATSAINLNGGWLTDIDIDLAGPSTYGILHTTGNDAWLRGVKIDGAIDIGMRVTGGQDLVDITGLYIDAIDIGFQLEGNSSTRVRASFISGLNAGLEAFSTTTFATFEGVQFVGLSGPAVLLRDSTGQARVQILGGQAQGSTDAVLIDGFTSESRAEIIGLHINQANEHGIRLLDASGHDILDSFIERVGSAADNTYDGIFLEGDSNRNQLKGNRIVANTNAADTTRYAVNISAATCDNNISDGNVAEGTFSNSPPYNDAGTGTQGTNFTV